MGVSQRSVDYDILLRVSLSGRRVGLVTRDTSLTARASSPEHRRCSLPLTAGALGLRPIYISALSTHWQLQQWQCQEPGRCSNLVENMPTQFNMPMQIHFREILVMQKGRGRVQHAGHNMKESQNQSVATHITWINIISNNYMSRWCVFSMQNFMRKR